MRKDQCHYCLNIASDLRDVELRPDGLPWKYAYASRICAQCREYLNASRQFRYAKAKSRPSDNEARAL